jgi:hypothetical protein
MTGGEQFSEAEVSMLAASARSTSAAARTSSLPCSSPTSPARRCCAASSSGPGPGAAGRGRAACRSPPPSSSSRGPSATPARARRAAFRRPGFELQRAIGTREPDERQLDVGRAALAEILRVEAAAA